MKSILIIYITLFVSVCANAQNRTVKGTVLDYELHPLWYGGIYIIDWVKIGETDSLGKYEVAIPDGVDSIIFRSVGYEALLVKLSPGCSRVEVIMIPDIIYDFITPEKVDRKRKRYFDKVNQLYPVAVDRGLFSPGSNCYKVIFQRHAPEMRERHKEWLRQKRSEQEKY